MAASATQRKRAQRARETAKGIKPVLVKLTEKETTVLETNCKVRGGRHGEYTHEEYIHDLIRADEVRLKQQLQALPDCPLCGGRAEQCDRNRYAEMPTCLVNSTDLRL